MQRHNKNSHFHNFIEKKPQLPKAHLDKYDLEAMREGSARSRAKNEFLCGATNTGKRLMTGKNKARPATSRGNVLFAERNAKEEEYGT